MVLPSKSKTAFQKLTPSAKAEGVSAYVDTFAFAFSSDNRAISQYEQRGIRAVSFEISGSKIIHVTYS